jgi:peptidoglycan/xylan/chitin deacetylase (PgdA/CDA1 family)
VSVAELSSDIGLLKSFGAVFTTLRDWWSEPGRFAGRFTVVMCFDDCYRGTYENGLPLLEKENVPAVLFQTSGMIVPNETVWEHKLLKIMELSARQGTFSQVDFALQKLGGSRKDPVVSLLNRPKLRIQGELAALAEACGDGVVDKEVRSRYPTAEHLQAAVEQGHELASHGAGHWARGQLTDLEFCEDLADSKETLAVCCGQEITSYSFPYGDHRAGDDRLCSRYFQRCGTTEYGSHHYNDTAFFVRRNSWPGPARNKLRQRRWLLSGRI